MQFRARHLHLIAYANLKVHGFFEGHGFHWITPQLVSLGVSEMPGNRRRLRVAPL